MKIEEHKGRTIYIKDDLENGCSFIEDIASYFVIDKKNPMLYSLGIDPKGFVEEDTAVIFVKDAASIMEVKADGEPCPCGGQFYAFNLKGKKEVHLEIIRGRLFEYEFDFKSPYIDYRKGKAIGGNKLEFTVFGPHDPSKLRHLRCTNRQTGEETLIEVEEEPFPPGSYSFTMPCYDVVLSLLGK